MKTVHPRTSGEHLVLTVNPPNHDGSSPHERGTPVADLGKRCNVRFIPARAGNTIASGIPQAPRTVHPRTSGEHGGMAIGGTMGAGSSPHERGTQLIGNSIAINCRFIPARAGNTKAQVHAFVTAAVHPRTSGEHVPPPPCPGLCAGSSPHERGTLPLIRVCLF